MDLDISTFSLPLEPARCGVLQAFFSGWAQGTIPGISTIN
jgi:hypothetical protein